MINQRPFRIFPAAALATGLLMAPLHADAETEDADPGDPPIEDLFKSELVFPQERGELQIASFPSYREGPEGSVVSVPIGIEYGITDAFQLEVEWDAYVDADGDSAEESGSGQGNFQLGLMYAMIDIAGSGFHVAAGAEYEIASGDQVFLENGNRADSQELYLIFAKDLAEASTSLVFVQVGVELQPDRREAATLVGALHDDPEIMGSEDDDDGALDPNVWFLNLGGYTPLGEAILSLELNLSEEEEERFVTPGISYQPGGGLELGLGVALGLTEEADDYQVIAKLLWEFED
ncbi:hypothetical protein [Thiorhodococcus minor]|uniref:Transporter n=1 Tax=Thiorhodococcus minor TaxID=57489 RepID=A0A6M0JW48_9GAMM|nr:hypothetical protein [Thiorhodococcus minor]NEV60823.1 hypothetical protein [Thiorhodococcus minor]